MSPQCPDCKTAEFMEYTGEDRPSESGEMYDVKVYKCHKCHGEFDEDELENESPITNEWDRQAGDNAWCLPPDMGDQ